MRTYRTKTGEDHQVLDTGECVTCGKEHKVRCRRKWKHEHVGGEGERQVLVFSRPGYGSSKNLRASVTGEHRHVLIADDGSICDRFVTPAPVRPFALPDQQEEEPL